MTIGARPPAAAPNPVAPAAQSVVLVSEKCTCSEGAHAACAGGGLVGCSSPNASLVIPNETHSSASVSCSHLVIGRRPTGGGVTGLFRLLDWFLAPYGQKAPRRRHSNFNKFQQKKSNCLSKIVAKRLTKFSKSTGIMKGLF